MPTGVGPMAALAALKEQKEKEVPGASLIRATNNNNNNNTDTQVRTRVCEALTPKVPFDLCSFWVPGHPVTQGSKRAFVAGGHARLLESGGARHKLWRHAINDEARRRWVEAPLAGAVALELVFDIQPPKSLTKARRAAGPVGQRSGDLDKLARAVLDALTGVVYLDDSQVARLVVDKRWAATGPGVTITIGVTT